MEHLVRFWEFAARLKAEPRRGWLRTLTLQRTESVADHSYALALICMLEGETRGYNVERLLKLALLHDLDESITGDFTPKDKESKGTLVVQTQRGSARETLLSCIPESVRKSYAELWVELENGTSKEAQLVHQLDKMEMALQAKEYAESGLEAKKLQEFFVSARNAVQDKRLRRILDQISPNS